MDSMKFTGNVRNLHGIPGDERTLNRLQVVIGEDRPVEPM